jgi:hypothetical protein
VGEVGVIHDNAGELGLQPSVSFCNLRRKRKEEREGRERERGRG